MSKTKIQKGGFFLHTLYNFSRHKHSRTFCPNHSDELARGGLQVQAVQMNWLGGPSGVICGAPSDLRNLRIYMRTILLKQFCYFRLT